MSKNVLKKENLKKLILSYNTLLIDGAVLGKKNFDSIYKNMLVPILDEIKQEDNIDKRIYIPKGIVDVIRTKKPNIYKKYFTMQVYIVEIGIETLDKCLKDSKSILVFVANKINGNKVLNYKQHKALFLSQSGFSEYAKQKPKKSQTERKNTKGIDKRNVKINGKIPKENDQVTYSDNNTTKQTTLRKRINGKGEGNIYETDVNLLAKIYKQNDDPKEKNTLKAKNYTFEKLKKFEKLRLDSKIRPYVCLPLFRVFNKNNDCVGFLMNRANGKEFNHILGSPLLRKQAYPNIQYKNLVKMCINFLNITIELHKHNIIIGDIKLDNIMFDLQDNVYIIDCDSFQIDGYPCPVGSPEFLHPTYSGKNMKDTPRILADDYYAISIFIFMILHLGVYPYDSKTSLTRIEAQKQLIFPYLDISKVPKKGKNCWNNLDSTLKDAFINTFNKGGKYASANKILGPDKWLKCCKIFIRLCKEIGLI